MTQKQNKIAKFEQFIRKNLGKGNKIVLNGFCCSPNFSYSNRLDLYEKYLKIDDNNWYFRILLDILEKKPVKKLCGYDVYKLEKEDIWKVDNDWKCSRKEDTHYFLIGKDNKMAGF